MGEEKQLVKRGGVDMSSNKKTYFLKKKVPITNSTFYQIDNYMIASWRNYFRKVSM